MILLKICMTTMIVSFIAAIGVAGAYLLMSMWE